MNYESKFSAEADSSSLSDYDLSGDRRSGLSRKWLIIGLIGLLLAGGAAFAFWQGQTASQVAAGDRQSQASSVTVIVPGQANILGQITANGSIAARRELPVGVVGEGGRVVSVPVEQGQWVRKGQVLAAIDRSVQSQQARSAAANIEVARADAKLAQSNLDRAMQLVERGFVSQANIEQLTATRDAAQARVTVAQAQYRELLARNARLNIVAPESGLLLQRNVEPGQTVSAGSGTLFSIAKGGEMELLARVGESELARLSTGAMAEVQPVGSSATFEGQIWQIEPTIDPQDRQGTVRVALAYNPALRPGGFASVNISTGKIDAPILPESAVLNDAEGSYVYIVDNENKARRRAVTVGQSTREGIAIASGLDGSESIVLRAGGFLNPGETVNPIREDAQ
ncbi:efflux RND transporter periplasmic adaptor subunit [Altererythrobacter lutimaris]|uniref:Efflux RND transporter periplasmic adaptor subunit n=1 Tax=Altererythrobacter lutimaris TaxID=2743979 RepID=A0A850HIK4_9SPHN|nr:efflux RND transporter periplasmic adaptor subunit [Altererythrobacter lutimaris]NVE95462.1 efflux RND transporter periplasmic adaptor subunit [Altererythrobacter lutimaris]